jgi:hypothetical protein
MDRPSKHEALLRNRILSVASDAFRAAAVSAEKAYFDSES